MSGDRGPRPPTPLARRLVRYVLGFGVAVAVGLGPFLGTVGVPGFKALLELFPEYPVDLKGSLIPQSAFLMGVVTVAVQFFSAERPTRRALRRWFVSALAALGLGFLALVVLSNRSVRTFPISAEEGVRYVDCCPAPGVEDIPGCMRGVGFQRARQECWDRTGLDRTLLALGLSYLFVTGGFGVLIGLLLLQEEARRRSDRRKRKRRSRRRAADAEASGSGAAEDEGEEEAPGGESD